MTQFEPQDPGSYAIGNSYSNGGYTNGYSFGNGTGTPPQGMPQQVYAPGFPPTAFMSIPANYPTPIAPPVAPSITPAVDPSHVTIAPVRPAAIAAMAGNGHGNGNGHHHGGAVSTTTTSGPNGSQLRLADLVLRAESAIDELQRLAGTAMDATAASSQAATDLQERLRLGVRMLQAFDVQIQRCEQVSTQAGPQVGMQIAAQVSNQINAMAQQCEMRVRSALEAFDQRVNESVPFLDERLRQAHEQVGRLVEERLANAERRIDDRYGPARDDLRRFADELATSFAHRLDAMVKEQNEAMARIAETRLAEVQQAPAAPTVNLTEAMAPLAGFEDRIRSLLADAERRAAALDASISAGDARLRSLIRESTEAADGLLGTVGTASTLKDLISDEARASRRLADEAHSSSRELQREMQDMLERCTIARSALEQQLHDLRSATAETESRLAAAKSLSGDIESTLRQVAPLDASLRQDGAVIQNVVETISSNVRQSLAEDMRTFSTALRSLAARAESAFANARFDEFSALPDSTTTPSPMLHDPIELGVPAAHGGTAAPAGHAQTNAQTHAQTHAQLNGHAVTDAHAGSISTLPVDTRRLTAEIMALDATTLLRPPSHA